MINPEHLTLGEVITALSAHDPATRIKVGFRNPHSWRGDYSELAFEAVENVTVREMLADARSALGVTFQGWKGGDYTMTENTFVWLVREEGMSDGETVGMLLLNLLLANTADEVTAAALSFAGRCTAMAPGDEQLLTYCGCDCREHLKGDVDA